jgi:integrase
MPSSANAFPFQRLRLQTIITFHDLRHTCASLLFQKNVHPKFVQELLGHASVAITLDTYSHMLPGMGGEAADAMGEALG